MSEAIPPRRSLVADQSGAIMVMGVFMAALMVGFIYYVKGIGEAIAFRESMQDAADSGAFAAATVHARGMNLIALINVTMVSVLAVVSAFRLLGVLASLGTIAVCVFPGADGLLDQTRDYERTYVRPLFGVLRAGNTAANAVNTAIPLAAEARAIDAASGAFRPPVITAFAYPAFEPLPAVGSDIRELTDRAGAAALPLASRPLSPGTVACFDAYFANRGGLPVISVEAAQNIMALMESPSALAGMVPQRLLPEAEFGGPRFQRGVVSAGQYDFGLSERGVKVASWGQEAAQDQQLADLATMSRISTAQGEFYYHGPGGRDEALWNQQWRARLRRVRLADPGGYPCQQPNEICDALDVMFQRQLHEAIVH